MNGKTNLQSFGDLLRTEWAGLHDELLSILHASTIRHEQYPAGFIGFAPNVWGDEKPDQVQRRADFMVRYERWFERFRLLFPVAIRAVDDQVDDADQLVRFWVARNQSNDTSVRRTIEEAVRHATDRLRPFAALIDQRSPAAEADALAIVDTNSLLRNPELANYALLLPGRTVQLVFPPVIVSELDDLKDRGRTPEVRAAAAKVVKRLKGLRDRGSLVDGVVVQGTTTARLIPIEPKADEAASWLDLSVPDDWLIASAVALQASHPSAVVVLVTGDLNLATKAEFAGIPNLDPG